MFVKIGDGKITDVIDEDGLTDEQKKTIKHMSEKGVDEADTSSKKVVKKSGS